MKYLSTILILLMLASCQQERSFSGPQTKHLELIADDFGLSKQQLMQNAQLAKRQPVLSAERRKTPRPVHPVKPPKGGDTTGNDGGGNPPPPDNRTPNVLLLVFDSVYVNSPYWNGGVPFWTKPTNLTTEQKQWILDSAISRYARRDLVVTTDRALYNSVPVQMRGETLFTDDHSVYGMAGGVAYIGSFGYDIPALVFPHLLGYNPKMILDAGVHEGGHMLTLRHQAKYQLNPDGSYYRDASGNLVKLSDYHDGEGLPYAPNMGVGYYRNLVLWHNGLNSAGVEQKDSTQMDGYLAKQRAAAGK